MVDVANSIVTATCRISGTIRYLDGTPAANCRVEAFDLDLVGKPIKLGKGPSDATGAYDIGYPPERLKRRGKTAADLIFKVFDAKGKKLPVTSPLISNASAATVVHLQIDRAAVVQSEYDRLLAAIGPRLRGTQLADLTEDNVTYLAAVTGQEAKHIERLADSARCARELSEGGGGELPEFVIYAWLTQGLPPIASKLIMQPRARLTQALKRAQAANLVAAPAKADVNRLKAVTIALERRMVTRRAASLIEEDTWPEMVANAVRHSRVAQELRPADAGQRLTVFDLFGVPAQNDLAASAATLLMPADKQRALAELLVDLDASETIDTASLTANGFSPAELALTRRLLSLSTLADNHLRLVHALHGLATVDREHPNGSLAYLAPLRSDDWRQLVGVAGVPMAIKGVRTEDGGGDYAAALEQRFESGYRTAVVAARVQQRQMAVPSERRSDLVKFFKENPDFEFGKQFVGTYLAEGGAAKLADVDGRVELKRELLRLERTVKLTDNHRQQNALLRRGFTSAKAIVQFGKRDFVRQVGGDPAVGAEKAAAIFSQADQLASTALHVALKHRTSANLPAAISNGLQRSSSLADAGLVDPVIPDLQTLFGPLDGSASDPCLTVLSPAAYFVDLLQFLGRRKLPSILITSPERGLTVKFNADDSFALATVGGDCETSGVTDAAVRITVSGNSFFAKSVSIFSEIVRLAPGEQSIRAELLKSQAADAKVMAEATRIVEVVQLAPAVEWSDVFPTDGSPKEIGVDDTDYALNVNGRFSVLGLSRYTIRVESNAGKSVDAVIAGNSFSADIRNSALPGDVATFTVRLSAQINGTEQVLSQFTNSLNLTRGAVTGSIVITAPLGVISLKQDDISFEAHGNFEFDHTRNIAAISVDVAATVVVEGDPVEQIDKAVVTFGDDGQGNPNGKGAFRCPLDFNRFENSGLYDATMSATLNFDPAQIANLPVRAEVKFQIRAQKSSLLIGSTEIAEVALAETQAASALTVLCQRRPDLLDIELSCANSGTTLPYVDLVLETLERSAAGPFPIQLQVESGTLPSVVGELNANRVPKQIAPVLQAAVGVQVEDGDEVVVLAADAAWDLIGRGYRLSLSKIDSTLQLEWFAAQTSRRSDQISGESEHLISRAYDSLKLAGYPWSLPLDLAAEASRIYLAHLGVTRAQLMETFDTELEFNRPEFFPMTGANFRTATERRGFTTTDIQIISGVRKGTGAEGDPNSGPWNFWGFKAAELERGNNSIPDPADATRRIESGNWITVTTSRVDVVLQQSGLSYDELRELLDMRFVNHTTDRRRLLSIELGFVHLENDTRKVRSSSLADAELVGGDGPSEVAAVLDRMHRFVRLWRKLGWAMRDVDQAILLARRGLDNDLIGAMDRTDQLSREHFGRPALNLGLYATGQYIDYGTAGEPSIDCLYDQLFLNPSIVNPPDPAFALNAMRNELLDPNQKARGHLPHIGAACGLSLQDAFLLSEWSGKDPNLSLFLISSMYWAGVISRTKQVEIHDLLSLHSLRGDGSGMADLWKSTPDVVVAQSAVELGLRFEPQTVGEINAIRFWKPEGETGEHIGRIWYDSGKQICEVQFRFESPSGWQEQRLPLPVQVEPGVIYVVSVNANNQYAFTANGIVDSQTSMSDLLLSSDRNGVTGPKGSFPTESQNSPNYYRDVGFVFNFVRDIDVLRVETVLSTGFSVPEVLHLLAHRQSAAEASDEGTAVARYLGDLRQALAVVDGSAQSTESSEQLRINVVTNSLQATMGLDAITIGKLLGQALASSGGISIGYAISDFLDGDFVFSDPMEPVTPARFPRQFRTVVRLKKIAFLVARFKLTRVSLWWLFGPSASGEGWLNPNRLPAAAEESPESVVPLLRAVNLFRLRDAMPGGEASLARIFAAAADGSTTREQLLDQVHLATQWNAEDLATLFGPDGFRFAADGPDVTRLVLQSEWFLQRLVDCFVLMRRIGATAAQCLNWSKPDVNSAIAADTRRLARSRHTESGWAAVSTGLRDTLRERQRASLVAFLTARDQLRDSADLYDRYLIDVEMRPAAQTSRIKQAAASVQSFVQRCLLNLEPDVPPEAIDTEQWAWMKNYRVWEANRKVFLFPENWIEPELRDDKSEVFRQLESDLLQSDVTHEAGLEAFKAYAERLGDIARLTVVGMCDESADDGMRIVHLLGRDGSSPHRHYYRQWRIPPHSDAGYWTPWEEVAAGIDSEHVQIFKFAGAIHIAWPTVKAEGDKGAMRITMNVVRHRRTGWTAPKRGQGQLWWVPPPNIDETRGLAFRVDSSDAERLQIVCRGASEPATSISPLPFALQVMPYEPHNSDPKRLQKVTLHVRNLAKYRDTFGRTYQWVAKDLEVKLVARLDPIGGAWGTDANEGELDIVNEPLLDHLDTNRLALPGDPPDKVTRVASVSFGVGSAAVGKYGAVGTRESFDVKQLDSFTIAGDTVVEIIHPEKMSPAEKQTISADRPLEFSTIGKFVFDELGSVDVSDAQGTDAEATLPFRDTEDYLSVYREVAERPVVPVGDPPQALTFTYVPASKQLELELQKATPGRFIATPPILSSSHPPFISAYSDASYDLIFRLRAQEPEDKPVFNVVPSSCLWGTQLRRALGNGKLTRAMELQQSFPAMLIANGSAIGTKNSYSSVGIDFDADLPWSVYNWETFFHVPIMVASQLTRNQRFEEAQRWFHLVFDPMSDRQGDDERRFWRFAPFQRPDASGVAINEELLDLAAGSTRLQDQIAAWRGAPFQPHAIARARPRAYQFFVVMKYLDNLISWGDRLFLNDTIESLSEATQLYLLASRILGRRPPRVAVATKADIRTYRELQHIDDFSNALVELESMIPAVKGVNGGGSAAAASSGFYGLYFGIPANLELSGYWSTVEDRLFKVRNSLNIEGTARQLPLYEPPIDPAILVRATAAGIDIASVINDLQGPMPFHRFNLLSQKALELANEVKSLGVSLLSAIEKQDGEMLAVLRSTHEVAMLKLISTVRQGQADEALLNAASLRKTRELIATRYGQYQRLLGKPTVTIPAEGVNARLESTPEKAVPGAQAAGGDTGGLALTTSESEHLEWLNVANNYTIASSLLKNGASFLYALPDAIATPLGVGTSFGGTNLGNMVGAVADFLQALASNASYQGNRSATIGGHKRRVDEWAFQSNLAAKELEQVDKQIAAADLRAAIASLEVKNHLRQIENAEEIDVLMRDKFSNQQLFRWMSGQAASLHFRAFQMAHAAAKRAEKAYRFELGLEDKESNFIQFGYWDSLKKGLMAGEALALDIRRMEAAYLEKNRREFEITKHVSLRQLDGEALLLLRATGKCSFKLQEPLFDLDFPGHFLRRIKSVSISIPCVVGPYTSVSGTLTMDSSKLRGSDKVRGAYADESNYSSSYVALRPIATSSSQNDSGLFELNFRDERYLPFEGGGAISDWTFALPKGFRAFDYSTISDLVIHLRYTARDGGEPLATLATDSLADRLNALVRSQSDDGLVALMSVRHDFATQWQSAKQQPEKPVSLQLFDELFPYMFRSRVRVRISGAVFAWLVLDDQGQWITSKRDGVVTIEPNKLPAVVIPKEVAMAVDDPWLVVSYGVDAVPTQGQVQ